MTRTRLLVSCSLALVVAALPAAGRAKEVAGRWGLGASTAFSPGWENIPVSGSDNVPLLGLPGLPGVSVKYAFNEKFALNPGLGVSYTSVAGNQNDPAVGVADYLLGVRGLYTVAQEPNANFYLGGGLLVDLRTRSPAPKSAADPHEGKQLRIPLVFGVELFFSRRSSFSVTAEGGLQIGYLMPSAVDGNDMPKNITTLNTVGGVFNLAFHWYFQAAGGGGEEEGGGE